MALVFFRTDGSFVVHDVPSGSYVVEVISPAHKFEPVRVDITSKGKMRWAFPDMPLCWWIMCAWQHSVRTHRSSAVGLMFHLRLYVSASFNFQKHISQIPKSDIFLPFIFMAWNKKFICLLIFLCSYPEIKPRHKLINCFIICQQFFFLLLPFSISSV